MYPVANSARLRRQGLERNNKRMQQKQRLPHAQLAKMPQAQKFCGRRRWRQGKAKQNSHSRAYRCSSTYHPDHLEIPNALAGSVITSDAQVDPFLMRGVPIIIRAGKKASKSAQPWSLLQVGLFRNSIPVRDMRTCPNRPNKEPQAHPTHSVRKWFQ